MATERIAEATGCNTVRLLQSWWLTIEVPMESMADVGTAVVKVPAPMAAQVSVE